MNQRLEIYNAYAKVVAAERVLKAVMMQPAVENRIRAAMALDSCGTARAYLEALLPEAMWANERRFAARSTDDLVAEAEALRLRRTGT